MLLLIEIPLTCLQIMNFFFGGGGEVFVTSGTKSHTVPVAVVCMSIGLGKMKRKCCEEADLVVGRADRLCGLYHSAGIPVTYGTACGCVVGSCWCVCSVLSSACILYRFGLSLGTLLMKSKARHSL